jgi:hypothetical protein
MGGPIEQIFEPLGEKLLAKLFPIFKDRNEIKIATNHFLTHVFITMTLSSLGWTWVALGSILLVVIAEYVDVRRGRYIDVVTRSLGWFYGLLPLALK